MTDRSVIHESFSIERARPAAQSRVFAAFASAEFDGGSDDTGGRDPAKREAGAEDVGDLARSKPHATVEPRRRH